MSTRIDLGPLVKVRRALLELGASAAVLADLEAVVDLYEEALGRPLRMLTEARLALGLSVTARPETPAQVWTETLAQMNTAATRTLSGRPARGASPCPVCDSLVCMGDADPRGCETRRLSKARLPASP